jgi:hypothetical protein
MVTGVPEPSVDTTLRQVTTLATDALYVAVGFGVLGFQRFQVRRRELEARLDPEVLDVVRTIEERAGAVARDVTERVTSLVATYVK